MNEAVHKFSCKASTEDLPAICRLSGCRYNECSEVWTQTTDYFQVVGIILGQLTVGFLGDWLGRRWGMIQVGCLSPFT